jgi:hypothetical protein
MSRLWRSYPYHEYHQYDQASIFTEAVVTSCGYCFFIWLEYPLKGKEPHTAMPKKKKKKHRNHVRTKNKPPKTKKQKRGEDFSKTLTMNPKKRIDISIFMKGGKTKLKIQTGHSGHKGALRRG